MKKILIIGISGTGKTMIANTLSTQLHIEVTHYDALVWKDSWVEIDEQIITKQLQDVLATESWIIEGYIHPLATQKLQDADTIIYLDYSGVQALTGGLQRWWRYRGIHRPEIANGCTETLDVRFLYNIWTRTERKDIERAIIGFEDKIIRLTSRKQTTTFLHNVLNISTHKSIPSL
jgi:adenylate kinase family enzyme